MVRVEALVTPTVIQWAREQAKLSLDEAAKLLNCSPDEIKSWELGEMLPSIVKARRFSEVYRRPLAVFYLPEPPQDFETLRDFRTLPDTEAREFSSELALLLRTTRFRQEWMKEYLLEEGLQALKFVGSADLNSSPREIAHEILNIMHLSPSDQRRCKSRHEALRLWIEKAESMGIFVVRQSDIPLREVRGFLLSDEMAPFIFINSDDSKSAQIFTLAHELAHLWLNISGISNNEIIGSAINPESSTIELFCNQVASEAVLEENEFWLVWNRINLSSPVEDKIHLASSSFNVSEEVIARRLLERNIITRTKYLELRELYNERWQEVKKQERQRMKESDGGPSYYITTVAKNGYSFTRTVVGAFMGGSISGRDASSLLNAKINNLPRLGETAGLLVKGR